MSTIRILLADDHTLLRAGIRSLLEKMPGVEVVGEAADGREALSLVKALQPGVVLMDIAMSGLNGLEATARIVKEFPSSRVIILSMHANEEYVLQTLRAGAAGYLLKDAATAELELAIQAVSRGDTYLSPAISKRVIEDYLGRINGQKSPMEQLTPRQREILQLIAEGKSTKEMAFLLNLSVKTVETHRTQLMDRLGIHDVPGLVRYAMRMGLISSAT
ncbi:response regulator [Pedosphaera parvula]|uniref:Two component transcriptional regulator, LuxR family n=1 Tax=Pedosphaera parvula (strain Ellin514) TaxID=320771 RepID=B9XSJ0_PEDPL|nr:response regulator transcription factor [Pedosphaera parvula]EEF57190.1 two component transcriptional regulator, LuxR family [Pedosphaera parvula Ellin514]